MTAAAMELQPRIIEIVAEILELESEEVTPSARFFDDLGGESIEVLELEFKVQQELGRQIDLTKALTAFIETSEAGEVTPASLDMLHRTYPFLAVETLPRPVTPEGLKSLLTVEAIAEFVAAAELKHNS